MTLPFPEQTFSRIYLESVIGYQSPALIRYILGEISRVITHIGICAVNKLFWKEGIDKEIIREIVTESGARFCLPPVTEARWSFEAWTQEIEAAGLRIKESFDLEQHQPQISPRIFPANISIVRSRLFSKIIRIWSAIKPGAANTKQRSSFLDLEWKWPEKLLEAKLFMLVKHLPL